LRVLGIDPGTRVTGYGVVDRGKGGALIHLLDGCVKTNPAMSLAERLVAIREAIDKVIEECGPDAVAVESVFFAKNARSAIMLGHARGVILQSAASRGLPIFEYAPRVIKLAITGYGNAAKVQMQKMVRLLLKTDKPARADAADALAAAICHIHHDRSVRPVSALYPHPALPREGVEPPQGGGEMEGSHHRREDRQIKSKGTSAPSNERDQPPEGDQPPSRGRHDI